MRGGAEAPSNLIHPMIGKTISHFEILESIGKGGMGVVYKCRDLELDRIVAIKFLADEIGDTEEAVERFMREARAASSLDHPNICTIHEIGRTDEGNLFIVMAYYGGDTLKSRMDAGLSVDQSIDLATQIAHGLAAAHEKGIVHRDIKPGNIVLSERGRAVIVDFGLATIPGFLALTKTGRTVGTAAYMAPEQLTGSVADARTDVWSLGVVLYEMINGKRPFTGDYEQAVTYAIVNQEPDPDVRTGDDPRLDRLNQIVSRCLTKDPTSRYQNAGELAADLESLGSAVPSDQTKADSGALDTQRSRRPIGMIAAVVAAAVLVIAGSLYWLVPTSTPPDGSVTAVSAQSAEAVPVLLILPFENLGDAEDAFFATGVSDEINGRLSTLQSLSVISRRSAERYADTDMTTRQIGEELGVDYILEGQVRWARVTDDESRVRISPMLIRVSDDTQLWAESYDRDIQDVFSIQAEVATRVAAELDARLTESDRDVLSEAPTDNVVAYEEFLRGVAFFDDQFHEMAAASFEKVLELDPNFLRAAYLLTRTYSFYYFVGKLQQIDRDRDALASSAAKAMERTIALAPGSPEAHLASGYYHYYVEQDFERAGEEFEAAVKLRPGDAEAHSSFGYLLRRMGRFRESAEQLYQAVAIDPNHEVTLRSAAQTFGYIRDYQTADSLFDRLIRLDPLNASVFCASISNEFAWKGVTDELIQRLESRPPGSGGVPACSPTIVDLAQRNFDKILVELESADENLPFRTEAFILLNIGSVNRYAGRPEAEVAAWNELNALVAGLPNDKPDRFTLIVHAWLKAGLGDTDEFLKLDELIFEMDKDDRLLQLVSAPNRAEAYALAGFDKQAIEILRADLESDVGVLTEHHLLLPQWDSLRDQPEFQALLD